ncbi:hypothetical protein [Bacteriovorax sp. Seq25_V]|uniref:hypothetical protein n=1 Tax=Bacteriovorax sp. Seq25_V TaxID=1201288 RepID=UPI00038A095D|nr:hypothetical protein [Bacteriovorax sp. Seq25_V]EQC47226.1 hypothetical protein M900_0561 [Bacteriovorax sp. Seq25_V]
MSKNILKNIIEHKLLDRTFIAKAISMQVRESVSLAQVAVENNLLGDDELIKLSIVSMDKGTDLSSCLKNNFPDIYKRAVEIKRTGTRGLFTIMQDEGFVSTADIKNAIEKASTLQENSDSNHEKNDDEIELSPAALESLRELQGDNFSLDEPESREVELSPAALESLRELQGENFSFDAKSDSDTDKVEISEAALDSLRELQGDRAVDVFVQDEELDVTVEINEAALESLRELGGMSEEDISSLIPQPKIQSKSNDLVDLFDEKKRNKILKIMKMIDEACDKKDDATNYLNSLYREIHVVSTAAKNVEAKFLYRLLDLWEHVIDRLFNSTPEKVYNVCESDFKNLYDAIDLCWEVRENELSSNEIEFFKNEGVRANYLNQINILKKILGNIN